MHLSTKASVKFISFSHFVLCIFYLHRSFIPFFEPTKKLYSIAWGFWTYRYIHFHIGMLCRCSKKYKQHSIIFSFFFYFFTLSFCKQCTHTHGFYETMGKVRAVVRNGTAKPTGFFFLVNDISIRIYIKYVYFFTYFRTECIKLTCFFLSFSVVLWVFAFSWMHTFILTVYVFLLASPAFRHLAQCLMQNAAKMFIQDLNIYSNNELIFLLHVSAAE